MIDTHCHIDHYPKPLAIAEDAENHGIITIAVTNLPSHFERLYPYLRRFKRIRPAIGFHPQLVKQDKQDKAERNIFERMISKTSYIGEIGLDFSKGGKFVKAIQVETLKFILSNINDRPRFITLHTRNAEKIVLDLLEEYNISSAVFHWYSGALTILEQAIQYGHYFSVNHAMIKSNKGRNIIEMIPKDRILTETDGPYIQIGTRDVRPSDIRSLLLALGEIYRLPVKEIEGQIDTNFNRIISPIKIGVQQ